MHKWTIRSLIKQDCCMLFYMYLCEITSKQGTGKYVYSMICIYFKRCVCLMGHESNMEQGVGRDWLFSILSFQLLWVFIMSIYHPLQNLSTKVVLKRVFSKAITLLFLPDHTVRKNVDCPAAPVHTNRHPLWEAAEAFQQNPAWRQRWAQVAWGLLGSVIICSGLSKAFSRACYKGSKLSAGLSMSQAFIRWQSCL